MSRLRLAVWSPLPPSSSGIADYAFEQLPGLRRRFDVVAVGEDADPATVAADLDLYHLGNSPAHAFVYRAARRRPGVAVLHEWSLHHLVLCETVERGDVSGYLREMRRAHGATGEFVGRQVARALGGELLPALYPLSDRVLEASLASVALTESVRARAARRLPGRPTLHLPHHVSLPLQPVPDRREARRALGLPPDAFLVVSPGLATRAKALDRAIPVLAALRAREPRVKLVVAGAAEPGLDLAGLACEAGLGAGLRVTGRVPLEEFVTYLSAADVVLALRFPSHGEISGALVRALGVGRPALVTAGTPAEEELPPGVVVPVDPGPREGAELHAVLARLLAEPELGETIGRLARAYVQRHHALEPLTARLSDFLETVYASKTDLLREVAASAVEAPGLLGYFLEEVRWGARDLGVPGAPLGLEPLLAGLAEEGT